MAQGETANNGGRSTGSFWESEDDFLYWEYLPDPRDNLTEEEYNAYRAEAEAFRLTPAGAATMADIERVVGVPVTQPDMQVEIAVLTKIGGPLTKTIKFVEGKIVSDGAACSMGNGLRRRYQINSLTQFANLVSGMKLEEALTLGRLRSDLPAQVSTTTTKNLTAARNQVVEMGPWGHGITVIACTADNLIFAPGKSAFPLLDHDAKGMPPEIQNRIIEAGGFENVLRRILPQMATTAHVVRASTSAGLSHAKTGERFLSSGGMHVFVHVADGTDAKRFIDTLHERCWLHGFGYYVLGRLASSSTAASSIAR